MWKAFFVFFLMFAAVSCGDKSNDQIQKDDDQIQTDDDQIQTDDDQIQTDDDQIQTDDDQTWSDPDTKYVWSSLAADLMSWNDALKYCNDLNENGRSDWYLPNISELRTLVYNCPFTETAGECGVTEFCTTRECRNDVCKGCGESDTVSYSKTGDRVRLWSSSLNEKALGEVWTVHFRYGSIYLTSFLSAVRCVAIDKGAERIRACEGPDNVAWNAVDEITQTWNGKEWEPSSTGVYNETASDKECRFVCENSTYNAETGLCECDPGYTQGDGKCVAIPNPCAVNQCGDLECVPEKINEEDKYTGDYTCLDIRNNYIWSEVSSKYMLIADAEKYCKNLVSAGYNDWQLPMIDALRMLIKNCPQTETDGACPATYDAFPPASCEGCEKMEDGRYSMLGDALKIWSATNSFGAWYIDFMKAEIDGMDWPSGGITTSHRHVRCVRYQIGVERSVLCEGPDNIIWNTVEKITQAWNGTEWEPSSTGVYNETASDKECRFICENSTYNAETGLCECDPGYTQGDGKCVAIANPCSVNQCGDLDCVPQETVPDSKKYTGLYTCVDPDTEYVWSKLYTHLGKGDWETSRKYCEDSTEIGFDDWRLPTINELRMLIKNCPVTETGGTCPITDIDPWSQDLSCSGCELANDGRYSKLRDDAFLWSSVNDGNAFLVNFSKASIYDVLESFSADTRCIRTNAK